MRIRFSLFALVLLAVTASFGVGLAADRAPTPAARINEFLADNDAVIADEYGEFDDVLELYNGGADPVDLGGMYLTDKLDEPTKFQIAQGIILPASGFVTFWADSTPEQGIYHTNFPVQVGRSDRGL